MWQDRKSLRAIAGMCLGALPSNMESATRRWPTTGGWKSRKPRKASRQATGPSHSDASPRSRRVNRRGPAGSAIRHAEKPSKWKQDLPVAAPRIGHSVVIEQHPFETEALLVARQGFEVRTQSGAPVPL